MRDHRILCSGTLEAAFWGQEKTPNTATVAGACSHLRMHVLPCQPSHLRSSTASFPFRADPGTMRHIKLKPLQHSPGPAKLLEDALTDCITNCI